MQRYIVVHTSGFIQDQDQTPLKTKEKDLQDRNTLRSNLLRHQLKSQLPS